MNTITTFNIEPVKERENLLKRIYLQNSGGAFNNDRYEKAKKASKLLNELRRRCDAMPKRYEMDMSNYTADQITGNGKYSLD